jgi:hypothetical protein
MAQDEKRLPEGTDKIIAGASGGSGASTGAGAATGDAGGGGEETITTDTTLVSERPVAASKGAADRSSQGAAGGRSGGGSSEDSGSMMDKIRSGRDKMSGQAADKAKGFVGQGIERSSDALGNIAKLVTDTAEGLDERLGAEYGDYARRAGSAIEDAARNLGAKDPDELIDDARNFVRKSPGVALAGAAIVGFALARLVKSGLDSASGRTDRGNSSGRGGSDTDESS